MGDKRFKGTFSHLAPAGCWDAQLPTQRESRSLFPLRRESGDSESCSGASLIPWTSPALRCQTGGGDQRPGRKRPGPTGCPGAGNCPFGISPSGHLCHGPPLPWRLKGQVWGRRSRPRPSEAKGSWGKCRRDTPALGDSLSPGWVGWNEAKPRRPPQPENKGRPGVGLSLKESLAHPRLKG